MSKKNTSPSLNRVVKEGCPREVAPSVFSGKRYHLLSPFGVAGFVLSVQYHEEGSSFSLFPDESPRLREIGSPCPSSHSRK